MILRLLVVTLALALGGPAQAQLYKWVDSEGKVQYSDKPPPADASGEQKLNIRKNPPSSAAPAPAEEGQAAGPKTAAEKEMDFRKRKVEEEQARQKSQAEEKLRQEQCINAQQRLWTYEDAGRIFTVMDESGDRKYLDDESRARGIEQAQMDIAKYCK